MALEVDRSGIKYHLNEIRQKIKFHKDLFAYILKLKDKNYPLINSKQNAIPKVIHYCWFGAEMPDNVKAYIDSWHRVLPEYKFKRWGEDNFPISKYRFAREALQNKKWAFLADICRLYALYNEGGIYLDTDIEVLKDFDPYLDNQAFMCYEDKKRLATCVMGFRAGDQLLMDLMQWYEVIHCDVDYTEIANTRVISKILRNIKFENLNGEEKVLKCGVKVYPKDYFNPQKSENGYLVTDNTCTIHHEMELW